MRRHKPILSIEVWNAAILWAAGVGFAVNVHFVVGTLGIVIWTGAGALLVWAMYDHSLAFRNLPRRLFGCALETPPPRFNVAHWERLQDRFVDIPDELAITVTIDRETNLPAKTSIAKGEPRSLLFRSLEQRGGEMLLKSGLEIPTVLTSEVDPIKRWRYALWYFKIPSAPGPDYSRFKFFEYEPAQFAGAALCSELISRIEHEE